MNPQNTPLSNRIVLKLGGSALFDTNGNMKEGILQELVQVVKKLEQDNKTILICVGGGIRSRILVEKFGSWLDNKTSLDHLSALTTTYHTKIVQTLFAKYFKTSFINHYSELLDEIDNDKVYFLGGMFPGQSTNAVAAMCAEAVNADFLFNLFNYDYIRDTDPESGVIGKELKQITYEDLEGLIEHFKQSPGNYELFDKNALKFIRRSIIPTIFINGNYPDRIMDWFRGPKVGTLVCKDD